MMFTKEQLERFFDATLTEKEFEHFSDLSLSEEDQGVIFRVIARFGVNIDDSSKYVGYFLQMKVLGTLAFRIMHSHHSWTKARKIFRTVGVDLDALPLETPLTDRVIAVRLFKKNRVVGGLWSAVTGVPRRGIMGEQKVLSSSSENS